MAVAALAGLAVALAIVVAAFPYALLRGTIEARMTERFGRPMSIGAIRRVDRFGFHPVIAVRDVRIAQPEWAGKGDFVRLAQAQAAFSVWPLLGGAFRPHDIVLSGLVANFVRAADGRTNWQRPGKAKAGGAGGLRDLGALTVRDARVTFKDARRDRTLDARLSSDARAGLRIAGTGSIHGMPVRVTFTGAPVSPDAPGAWPFTASLDGAALAMTARGTMDTPLNVRAMDADVTARAADLKRIDDVIEAGLFRTQPVRLTAHVRRDAPRWTITRLNGTIGRSSIAGRIGVDKVDGRSKIDATVRSAALDFDDLSSDEGQARGAALERRLGPRLVPNLRVDIGNIARTDGVLRFRVDRILSRQGPPAIRTLRGVATLDHRLLRVDPLVMGLARGAVTGRVIVDQHDGQPAPRVTLDLALRNSDVQSLVGGSKSFTGRVEARGRLRGTGDTLRAAVGRSDGHIGFVIRDGSLPEKMATALGFDALRTLLASDDARAGLRCVAIGITLRAGQGRAGPLIVDTTESRLDGTGTVTFPDERLDIRLQGAPKKGGGLRLPGAVLATGTIKAPSIYVPPQVKSVGNVLKAIGRAIRGDQGELATDADCAALGTRVMR